MTQAEIMLWNEVKQKRLLGYDFHRQKPIDEFVVDFFCPRLMLAIEIDGVSHEGKMEEDAKRQKEIEGRGIRFLRFLDDEVKTNLDGVVEAIEAWILEYHQRRQKERGSLRPARKK